MRLVHVILNDIKLQYRNGFYAAYLFVSLFYIITIKQFPESIQNWALLFVIITDPSVLGFYFIGGMLLLERRQNTFSALFISPLTISEYIVSKAVSLGLLSLLSSLAIITVIRGFAYNVPIFSTAVLASSLLFTLIGITLGVRARDINRYLFISPLYLIVFAFPLIRFFDVFDERVLFLVPTNGFFNLFHAAVTGRSLSYPLLDFSGIVLWLCFSWFLAHRYFRKYIIEGQV